jgi:hypothetical protein
VVFSDDLNSILVKFAFPIGIKFTTYVDPARYCQTLLNPSTLNLLGLAPICQISVDDPSVFLIILGQLTTINIGDSISIVDGFFQHTACSDPIKTYMYNTIKKPTNIIAPTLLL